MAASEALAGRGLDSRSTRRLLLDAAPSCLVAGGAILGLATAQGGYFSTSWGWASTAFLWLCGLWAVVSGRTDGGRLDLAFAGLLTLFTSWVALSVAWSVAPSLTVLELQRVLVYAAGVAALLLLAQREQTAWLVGTILAAITGSPRTRSRRACSRTASAVSTPSPCTGSPSRSATGTASEYFCVLGVLLGVGVVADAGNPLARALAAASVVVGAMALYFTYSRGSWLALAGGVVVGFLVSPLGCGSPRRRSSQPHPPAWACSSHRDPLP